MKLSIGVIFGGKSLEHELSILTAIQAMDNIDKERYEVVPIYITKDLTIYTGGMLRYIDSYKDLLNLLIFALYFLSSLVKISFPMINALARSSVLKNTLIRCLAFEDFTKNNQSLFGI